MFVFFTSYFKISDFRGKVNHPSYSPHALIHCSEEDNGYPQGVGEESIVLSTFLAPCGRGIRK
jgi:hypothetical protein